LIPAPVAVDLTGVPVRQLHCEPATPAGAGGLVEWRALIPEGAPSASARNVSALSRIPSDAELHFIDGELDGLKLVGFAIWERRGDDGHTVTFPARQYAVNGARRSFALLRPIADVKAQNRVR
jgi:hypothetical protein